MSFVKDNWLLLLILAIIIYFAYKYYSKVKAEQVAVNGLINANQILGHVTSNGNVTVTPPAVTQPSMNTNNVSWKIGDKIYAGSTGVNAYSAPTAGANSIVKFYNKDSYIGTFLANENGYAKVIIQEPTNSLLEAFGYQNNTIRFLLINQVYSK